ncbi:hypothetical protein C8J56DRAFT_290513 [Mycena floridula]|nr:hypothetical protein C8J56DRAFT_290513 [Mycena floridula]
MVEILRYPSRIFFLPHQSRRYVAFYAYGCALRQGIAGDGRISSGKISHRICTKRILLFINQFFFQFGPHPSQYRLPLTLIAPRLHSISCRLFSLFKTSSDSSLIHSETVDAVTVIGYLAYGSRSSPVTVLRLFHDALLLCRVSAESMEAQCCAAQDLVQISEAIRDNQD